METLLQDRAMVLAQTPRIAVTPLDPRIQGGAALVMLAVAFCAGLLPARRAAAIGPVDALRAD